MPPLPVRIAQITDTHLFGDKNNSLLGVKTEESFSALLHHIKNNKTRPDMILLTGDLTQDGSEEGYIRLADQLSELEVPIYCIPGNHDNSSVMDKIYPRGMISTQKQLILDGWQLILLDSHVEGKVEGHLSKKELHFLEKCLKSYPDHAAIIVFHHQPVKIESEWLDKLGINNAEEFWTLLQQYPQVNAVLFGHIHQEVVGIKNNIHYYSTPSTCIQFKGKCNHFALEELGPAYRMIELHPNKTLKTHITRLDGYVGNFEADAKGY